MSIQELQELLKLIKRNNLVEFSMKDGDFEIAIKSEQKASALPQVATQLMQMPAQSFAPQAPAPAPAAPAPAPAAAPAPKATDESKLVAIKSPMVGTFYRAPGTDKPPFTKVGDRIAKGDVVCIVEAMKLFNEIEAEVSGTVVKVLVEDAQPIEYDQVLFMIDPS